MKRYVYIVEYGNGYLSEFKHSKWSEACAFMKHCIDEGTQVKGVRKEEL